MELVLHRRYLGKEYTIGSLYLSRDLSPNPSPQGRGMDSRRLSMKEGEAVPEVIDTVESSNTESEHSSAITAAALPPPLWGGGQGGEVHFCDTLEDVDRGLTQSMSPEEIKRIKIPHETAIPTGVYKVTVNMSPAKKRLLPRLLDVPGFSGILIHRGNTKHDSSGCILVGENKVKGKVINSTQYEKRLVEILSEAQEKGEEIKIKIINSKIIKNISEEFVVNVTKDKAKLACKNAVAQLGWRIMKENTDSMVCKEVAAQSTSFTWPAEVTISIFGNTEDTKIVLNGSIMGFGPVQSGHLKGQIGRIKNLIETCSLQINNQSTTQDKKDSLSGELERLAELHSKGILSDAEFKNAKSKLLNI
jgi:hypothetical protein